jgi:NAD-dependent SIR2 family protein deacetylase
MTKTIKISDDTHALLLRIAGGLQARNGKAKTLDDAIKALHFSGTTGFCKHCKRMTKGIATWDAKKQERIWHCDECGKTSEH